MSYQTQITFKVKGDDPKKVKDITASIQKRYNADLYDESSGFFNVINWDTNPDHYDFFVSLGAQNTNTLIELDAKGENDDDFWKGRFLDGESEMVEATLRYETFRKILTKEDKVTSPSIKEKLEEALTNLKEIAASGYWPFASPAPCSTEVKIKDGINSAIRGLEKATFFHEQMFGKTGRDPMKVTSMAISEYE